MALSRVKSWIAGEVLTASDLNAEFNNVLGNSTDLVSPFTKAVSMGGFSLNFDAANTIALTAATNGISLTGGAFNTPQGADIASATTLNLDTATGNLVDVTGTTTITAITLSQGRARWVRFTGALTLTHGASLVLPGAVSITTAAGDYALFMGYASSVVRCAAYVPSENTAPSKIVTTAGDLLYASAARTLTRLAVGAADLPLVVNAGATAPQWGFANKTANTVFAGPSSGAAAAPAFRALVPADLSMTPITNSISGDVALNNTATYFTGPTVAQGTSGTWFVSGTVTLKDTAGAAQMFVKLWDGATVIASGHAQPTAANVQLTVALSGFITSPAGNLRISVRDGTSTSGLILNNESLNAKDSTITAIRIA